MRAPGRWLAALAVAFAWLLAATPAWAVCQPDPAATGQTVTCSGATTSFQAGAGVNQLTVDVLAGATVNNPAPGGIALELNNLNTVNNNGAVGAGDDGTGISALNRNTITNAAAGTITVGDSVVVTAIGVSVIDNNTIINLGSIQAGSGSACSCLPAGGIMGFDRNFVSNVGSIGGGDLAFGIFLEDRNTVLNSGTIAVGIDGLGIGGRNNNVITNAAGATITVGDFGGGGALGISVNNSNVVNNFGSIIGGVSSVGIDAGSSNVINNAGAITVSSGFFGAFGISAINNNVITNTGTINVVGDAVTFAGAFGISANSNNTILNLGSVTTGSFGFGLFVNNNNTIVNSGSVAVGSSGFGIFASNNNNIVNDGSVNVGEMSAGVSLGSNNLFTNNGSVRAGPNGTSVMSCDCDQDNVVINNGTLDGQISLDGAGHSVTNNGLVVITDPGTPVGAAHLIMGSFSQGPAGTLGLRVDNTATSDMLAATSATLGGTLRAIVQPGLYGSTTFYPGVVTAADPITTTFQQTTTGLAFLTATATYNPNSVDLTLNRIPFNAGGPQNRQNFGTYLEQNYSPTLTGPPAAFFTALLQSTSAAVLDQLTGEGNASTQQTAFDAGNMFTKTMMDQVSSWLNGGGFGANDLSANSPLLQYAPTERRKRPEYKAFAAIRPETRAFQPRKWRVWTAALGGTQSLHGDAVIGSADSSSRIFGLAGGVDYQVAPDLLVGMAAAGTSSEFSVPGRATSGTLDGAHLGLYGVYRWGAAYLAGTLSYSHFRNDTDRTIAGVGPTEIAKGQFTSDQFGGRLQVGHQFAFDRFKVTPFAAVQYMRLWQSGYGEVSVTAAGAPGILGLNVQPRTVSSLPTFLGAEIDTRIDFAHGATLVPFARASWVHEFMPDRSIAAAMGILPTGTFIVDGPRAASDAARIEAGANLYLSRNIAFFGNFTGEYSSQGASSAGSGGLRVSW